ncbi:class C beta-lactamase [Herbaspirillum sp. LeCh32-8]|uniref:class C beta-lactamase n=1 Tax=Herbaspirillum sp. LeCh32-8 TaxID=2821356 RepID=UPI0024730F05|nr:class C beta-lactamase [Herbaspirillum sp. LeCh32-8]
MTGAQAADPHELHARQASDSVIAPLMEKYRIPGMAVGVISAGKSYVFNYGAASLQPRKPVTDQTLFELGSISKTLTATMTSYAQVEGKLSLDDKVEKYLPALRGSAFGQVRLLDLGTHTPGGLPLQLPDGIGNEAQLMDYYKAWKPSYPAGTQRTYANPGIGLLGLITARSMHEDFTRIMEKRIFPALDMQHSFIKVPAKRMGDYAQGYNKEDKPTRMKGDALAPQAYGVKSTAADMLAFMRANMNPSLLEDTLSRAISGTHVGYYRTAQFTQDLIWEQYAYPVSLPTLLEGNSTKVIMEPTPVTAITPPQAARNDVWINKTGSTNGFGAYIAFIPARGIGIVMLANRNFPIDARVTAAHDILTALAPPQ